MLEKITKIEKLDKDKAYIFYIDMKPYCPEQFQNICNNIKYACREINLDNVLMVPNNGTLSIELLEKAVYNLGYKLVKLEDN